MKCKLKFGDIITYKNGNKGIYSGDDTVVFDDGVVGGNIYLSGYNLQILKLLENGFDMTTYIDKILEKYKKDIDYMA